MQKAAARLGAAPCFARAVPRSAAPSLGNVRAEGGRLCPALIPRLHGPHSADMMFVHVPPTPTSAWCDAAVPVSFRLIRSLPLLPTPAPEMHLSTRELDRRLRRSTFARVAIRAPPVRWMAFCGCVRNTCPEARMSFFLTVVLRSPAPSAPPPTRPPSAPTTALSTRCAQRGLPFAHGCSHTCVMRLALFVFTHPFAYFAWFAGRLRRWRRRLRRRRGQRPVSSPDTRK